LGDDFKTHEAATEVFSARGDPRDYIAAKKLFPNAKRHFSGWTVFGASNSSLLNLPWSLGLCRIKSRYELWAKNLGVPFGEVQNFYSPKLLSAAPKKVGVHLGAQWKVRQYPYMREVCAMLRQRGIELNVFIGPGDTVTPDEAADLKPQILRGTELVDAFKNMDLVLVNDSGPAHLSQVLKIPTVVLFRISSPLVWALPATRVLHKELATTTYRKPKIYMTDDPVGGWPTPSSVFSCCLGNFYEKP
jgi:hypothetical protein